MSKDVYEQQSKLERSIYTRFVARSVTLMTSWYKNFCIFLFYLFCYYRNGGGWIVYFYA